MYVHSTDISKKLLFPHLPEKTFQFLKEFLIKIYAMKIYETRAV